MNLWIVLESNEDHDSIVGVFATEELARRVISDSFGMPGKPFYYLVQRQLIESSQQ